MSGKLEKITIRPYTDKGKQQAVKPVFVIPINPETYSQNYKIVTEQRRTGGNQGSAPTYKLTTPEQLKLDFVLDNTGTIEGNLLDGTPVRQQVADLLGTVYYMQGESHRPPLLKINWGELTTFECMLTSLDVNYILFARSGDPLRAKVSATFTQHIEDKKRTRIQDKRSPDLTRIVRISDGDTLPLLCHKHYNDASYYQKVAYVNDLVSVRSVKAGDELKFPPVKPAVPTK